MGAMKKGPKHSLEHHLYAFRWISTLFMQHEEILGSIRVLKSRFQAALTIETHTQECGLLGLGAIGVKPVKRPKKGFGGWDV